MSKTVVEQFSSWNQQLKTLLREAEARPGDDDPLSLPPPEDDDDEDDDKSNVDPNILQFKKYASDIGKDLYTLTVFDYADDFAEQSANQTLISMLKKIDDPLVDQFVNNNQIIDSDGKTVSVLFYNDATDEFFMYDVGEKQAEFTPDLAAMRKDQSILKKDQTELCDQIATRGKRYMSALQKNYWKAAEPPSSKEISNSLSSLLYAIDATSMPKEKSMPMPWDMTDEQRQEVEARAKRMAAIDITTPEFQAELEALRKERRENEKKRGVGRKKR